MVSIFCCPIDKAVLSLLVTSALFFLPGCRGPLNPYTRVSPEPSFDRLLELENSSVSPNSSTHPQVSKRRPGSTKASARHSAIADEVNAADHYDDKIDDMDDLQDVASNERELLRQTQIALKNMNQADAKAPPVTNVETDEVEHESSLEPSGPVKLASAVVEGEESSRGSSLAIRMTDQEDVAESPVVEQGGAADRHPGDGQQSDSARQSSRSSAAASPVQPAGHNRYVQQGMSPESMVASAALEAGSLPAVARELRWDEHLQEAMNKLSTSLEEEDGSDSNPKEMLRQQVILRLLALAAGQREQMTEVIEGLQAAEQDYFRHQLTALMDSIDPDANPVSSRRWSLVMLNQRKAFDHLATLCNLEISNLSFCTEVESFGVTERFSKYQFTPDQEVLLYCELDNFTSEKYRDGKGFETQLQGSYEIVDTSGRRIADQLLPMDSHICRNRRRDYFIAYRIYMPQSISPGKYTLRLTIEDIKGKKFGQSNIDFQIQ